MPQASFGHGNGWFSTSKLVAKASSITRRTSGLSLLEICSSLKGLLSNAALKDSLEL